MKDLKIVNLQQNGASFDANTYSATDNLDAYIIYKDSLVSVRVAFIMCGMYDEVSINILSDKKQMDEDFLGFLEDFEEDFDARKYVVNAYQEYLYPFVYDDEIIDFDLMIKWMFNNVKDGDNIILSLSSCSRWENKIIINKNDIGITVDYYDYVHDEPCNTKTFNFEDYSFKEEQ